MARHIIFDFKDAPGALDEYPVLRIYYRALFAVLLGIFFFCASSSFAATHPSADLAIKQKKQDAIAFLQAGENEKAYDAFMSLLREEPGDPDINMGIALTAYATKRYAQALLAYERLLEAFPRDSGLRVQLARVYVALGEPESARLELEKARHFNPDLSDGTIKEVLEALASETSRWQFSGRLSAGFLYDDNANQGPRSNRMTLGNFQDLFVDGVKKKSSMGNYLLAMVEAGYRIQEDGKWWLMADVSGYQRWNYSSGVESNNSYTFGRGAAGVRYMGEKALFDLRFKNDVGSQHHKKAKDQDIYTYGPELIIVLAPVQQFQLITRAGMERRDHSLSTLRDGLYWNAAQYGRLFFGESNHEIMLGVAFTGNDPNLKDYRYFGVEPSLRLAFKLPADVTISPFVSYKEESYEGPATGLETEDRLDKQWRAGTILTWDINKSLSLDVTYQHVDNDSNSALYKYTQNYVSTGLTWKF